MASVVQSISFPKLSELSSAVLYSSFLLFCPLLVTFIRTASISWVFYLVWRQNADFLQLKDSA